MNQLQFFVATPYLQEAISDISFKHLYIALSGYEVFWPDLIFFLLADGEDVHNLKIIKVCRQDSGMDFWVTQVEINKSKCFNNVYFCLRLHIYIFFKVFLMQN